MEECSDMIAARNQLNKILYTVVDGAGSTEIKLIGSSCF